MEILNNTQTDTLQHIIAVYQKRTVVYDYDPDCNRKLSVGKPLTQESARGIFQFIEDNNLKASYSFKGIIPSNVLSFTTETASVLWYTPPQMKHLYFSDTLPINSGLYAIPYLVWKLTASGLSVFATKEKPIDVTTPLYQAPFLNVGSNGNVCMGTAKYKTRSSFYDAWITKAENAFFNSVFTHTNTDTLLSVNIVDAMQEMFEKKTKAFNTDLLVKTRTTLKDII